MLYIFNNDNINEIRLKTTNGHEKFLLEISFRQGSQVLLKCNSNKIE